MRLGIRLPSDFLLDFQHSCFEVAVTERIAQIPAHAEKDDLGLIVTPLEEIGFGHRQTSEEDSGSGQSTIIDMRHPFFATQPTRVVMCLLLTLITGNRLRGQEADLPSKLNGKEKVL
jgi:hypothetical protein